MASAASAPVKMRGDLFLMHKQTEALWRTLPFDRNLLMRALGHPDVTSVHSMYMGLGSFKNMDTRLKRTLMVYGYDPHDMLLDIPTAIEQKDALKAKDTILFDKASRPEFGYQSNAIIPKLTIIT
jgi:putative ABC transport system permease protein